MNRKPSRLLAGFQVNDRGIGEHLLRDECVLKQTEFIFVSAHTTAPRSTVVQIVWEAHVTIRTYCWVDSLKPSAWLFACRSTALNASTRCEGPKSSHLLKA